MLKPGIENKSNKDQLNQKNQVLYNLRMRASRNGSHISGAERIISSNRLYKEIEKLLNRAIMHSRGNPDEIHFKIEVLKDKILYCDSLPISTILTENTVDSREKASALLSFIGIPSESIIRGFDDIAKGASPDGRNMRGAMLIDIDTGERIEPDPFRGIRVSRIDVEEEAEKPLELEMKRIEINSPRVKDAIVLATKVILAGTIAELCWSDNPDYTTGYVASKRYGYVRFPYLKQEGDIKGGRVFFLKRSVTDPENYISFLQNKTVLIKRISPGFKPCSWEEFLKRFVVRAVERYED